MYMLQLTEHIYVEATANIWGENGGVSILANLQTQGWHATRTVIQRLAHNRSPSCKLLTLS